MANLTKRDIAERVSEKCGVNITSAENMVGDIFETISEIAMNERQVVYFTRLGGFFAAEKAARPGRNPKTKEPHIIPARVRLSFRMSDATKREIANV